MELEINDIAVPGVIRDLPPYQLPPEAWSEALNMQYYNKSMRPWGGWEQIFGTPGVAPYFALPVVSPSQTYWLYMSLTKGYVYDGSSHTNITRQTASVDVDYNANYARDFNGTIFAGIPVLNTGNDDPQYWSAFSTSQKLQAVPNWPSGGILKCIRSFGAYLVGIYYSVGGNTYPHLVKWSASASSVGALPQSWDETDDTLDAGEYDLPDTNAGVLQEAMILGPRLFLYKEQAIWSMRYIGGRAIFSFDNFSTTTGILAPRCVITTGDGGKHIVATQDDIVIHDGTKDPVSILNDKLRKSIFRNLDENNYLNSFMFPNYREDQMIFCYPEEGSINPTRAVIFNYQTGTLTEADGISFRSAATGRVETSSAETWADNPTEMWSEDTGPWSQSSIRQLVFCDPDNTKFLHYNQEIFTRDTANFTTTLKREGLAIIGKNRKGDLIVNHRIFKFLDRIWPKIRGGVIQVRIGYQATVDGAVTWGSYQNFDPSTDVFIDVTVSGRAIAVEFTMPVTSEWELDGYKVNIEADGEY